MNGKGSRDRTTDRDAYDRGWERIFGGNIDSTKAAMLSDVGATPTSSTIEKQPFVAPPIRHGIRKIIE
jgi:hypothetical protein